MGVSNIRKPTVFEAYGGGIIVNFPVGYMQPMSDEAAAANARIDAALRALSADIALAGEWQGNLIYHKPHSRLVNPEITQEMKDAFIAEALRLYPGSTLTESWVASMHGVASFSVRLSGKLP